MIFREYAQLLVEHKTRQPHPPFAIVIVHIPVYLVLVDAFSQQLADDEIDLGPGAVEGEAARIGHHTAIDRHRTFPGHQLKTAQLPNHTEHHLASRAQLRV